MEIPDPLRKAIIDIQNGMKVDIQRHHMLAVQLRDDTSREDEIRPQLLEIQKHIMQLNEDQKLLILKLKQEIEENIKNGFKGPPVYNFNLYNIKPGQLESKKRRRKDLVIASKPLSQQSEGLPSSSPSPSPSSNSSTSDESFEFDETPRSSPKLGKMQLLPAPIARPRPKLLPDAQNMDFMKEARRNLKSSKSKKNQKAAPEEENYKEIPMFPDPTPSPEPSNEEAQKSRYMAALGLIPKEMIYEIQNRKVERKRRSTATNPQFVYNNDWEIPAWKRSKTYLSPTVKSKTKGKTEDKSEVEHENVYSRSSTPKDAEKVKKEPLDLEKAAKACSEGVKLPNLPSGLIVERIEGKSRTSSPESTLCVVCHVGGLLSICKTCSAGYHLSCASPDGTNNNSTKTIICPNCKPNGRHSPDDKNSETSSRSDGRAETDSSKEEFASKCPNVAQSYDKLKDYIKRHKDLDSATLFAERETVKTDLLLKNQQLYCEKEKLEEQAAELSEALLAQQEFQNAKREEERILKEKVQVIVDFITLYQKAGKIEVKVQSPPEDIKEQKEMNSVEEFEEEDEETQEVGDEHEKEKEDPISNEVVNEVSLEMNDVISEPPSSNQSPENCLFVPLEAPDLNSPGQSMDKESSMTSEALENMSDSNEFRNLEDKGDNGNKEDSSESQCSSDNNNTLSSDFVQNCEDNSSPPEVEINIIREDSYDNTLDEKVHGTFNGANFLEEKLV